MAAKPKMEAPPEDPSPPRPQMKPDPELRNKVAAKGPETLCAPAPVMDVRFSPKGDCTEGVEDFIGSAKKSVRVQAYSFTSVPIAGALVKARERGVDVVVLLDKSNVTARSSQLKTLQDGDVSTFIDSKHAIAHDKVIIVDGASVETGSFNFTNAAEKSNAENCLFIRDQRDMAKSYTDNWNEHRAHSTAPVVAAKPTKPPHP